MAKQKTTIKQIDRIHLKQHGKTFHASLADGVRAYIESSTLDKDGNIYIEGWAFHEKDTIKDIKVSVNESQEDLVCNTLKINRQDVKDFYAPYELGKVGFKISIPNTKDVRVGNTLIIQCNTNKSKTFKTFESSELTPALSVNDIPPGLTVVDNFYNDPYAVRELALKQNFDPSQYHKGKRTTFKHCVEGTKEKIEKLLGLKITDWDNQGHNMVFQYCTPADPLVYHYDGQTHAAVVFLTPDPPPETGTSFFRHKKANWLDRAPEIGKNGIKSQEDIDTTERTLIGSQHDDFLDGTKWEEIDRIGNKFNRFAMWDAKTIHAASKYFGTSKETGRLFHMFFFNAE